MSTKISIQPDLMKLKGAKLVRDTAGIGYIKIPIDEAGLTVFDRKEGKGCGLSIMLLERADNHGNDFMLSRGYTKAESEYNKTAPADARKQTEILGNGKYLQRPEAPTQTNTAQFEPESAGGNDPDDIPF
jgi:hypothetical protein